MAMEKAMSDVHQDSGAEEEGNVQRKGPPPSPCRILTMGVASSICWIHWSLAAGLYLFHRNTDASISVRTSCWIAYHITASLGAVCGFLGAGTRRPQLLTPFLNLHFISLLLITFTALDVISPIRFRTVLPVLPNFDFDAVHVCQDIDAAYGADPVWLETCSSSFEVVKTAVGWTCLVLTAGQWWFIRAVCILKKKLEERNMSRGRRRDVEMEYDVNKR